MLADLPLAVLRYRNRCYRVLNVQADILPLSFIVHLPCRSREPARREFPITAYYETGLPSPGEHVAPDEVIDANYPAA
jgi:hypothetical protein